jgi:hypothetical protein
MQGLRALQEVLDPHSKALLANHRLLHRNSAVWRFRHELDGELSSWLASLESAALVAEYCKALGLETIEQHMHGKEQGRHMDRLDCVTLFRKP